MVSNLPKDTEVVPGKAVIPSLSYLKIHSTNHSTLIALAVPAKSVRLPLIAPECQEVLLPGFLVPSEITSFSRNSSWVDQRGVKMFLSECGSLVVTVVNFSFILTYSGNI